MDDTHRQRMQRYFRDMAVNIAVTTHKDILSELGIDTELVSEIATLAAQTALEKYDVENRTLISQADSFVRMVEIRNRTRIPPQILMKRD